MPIDANSIKDLLVPASSAIGIIATAVGIWLSLKEYRLKLQAEKRLTESTRAETDIRLMTYFTDILEIATGRRKMDVVYSKEVVEKLLETLKINPNDENFDYQSMQIKLAKAALFEPTVGKESVRAAFASIATLAQGHDILLPSAIEAFEALGKYQPDLSKKYLEQLRQSKQK